MAIPAWVNRLRPGSFTSPAGVVSNFKIDILSRIGGKKASIHEILNKDEAIPQDQGNRSQVFPIEAYFTDDNGDQEADAFYDSLRERYTADAPGVLNHPRWGDINVMPFEFQQVETLVTGAGVFRVPVEFREIPPQRFPTPEGLDQSDIVADITDLESTIETANASINVDKAGDYASFGAKTREAVNVIGSSLSSIVSGTEDIQDRFDTIQADIDTALNAGTDAVIIMSQVLQLIRTPSQIFDATLAKIQGFGVMMEGIALAFLNEFTENPNNQEKLNNARMAESLLFFGASATAEAGLFTEYSTREAAGDALDLINAAFDNTEQRMSEIYQLLADGVTTSFDPNHNTGLDTLLLVGKTNSILIDRSFDLKLKQITILSGPSDPITLTWRFYKDMSQLEFFIETNNIQDTEFIEIPAGREIVAYV